MKRPFCAIGGGLLTGAFLASKLTVTMQLRLCAVCVLLVILILCLYRRKHKAVAAVFLSFLCIGCLMFAAKTTFVYNQVIPLDNQSGTVTGTVTDFKIRANGGYTYYLDTEKVILDEPGQLPKKQDFRLIVFSSVSLNADYYDRLTVPVSFFLPGNNDLFDSTSYYKGDNIFLLSSTKAREALVEQAKHKPLIFFFQNLNRQLCSHLDKRLSPDNAAIVKSMVLGVQDSISYGLKQSYQYAGIIHLLAISGIHLSILAGFLLGILRRLPTAIQATATILIIWAFVLLSGVHLSAVRSAVMITLMLCGRMFRRQSDGLNSLCIAGFFIVLSDVYAIMDIGFCMSFLATLGILTIHSPIRDWANRLFRIKNPIADKIISAICITLSASIYLMPISVINFGYVSIISPVANLVAGLTAPVILILGFLLVGFSFLPLPDILFQAEELLITAQNNLADCLGRLSTATIGLDSRIFQIWLIAALALLLCGYLRRKQGEFLAFCLCAVLLFAASYYYNDKQNKDAVQLFIIGDGTKSNVILTYDKQATVISTADDNYIDKTTLNFLKGKGIGLIDNLFLLYPDFEAYQDTTSLLESIPVNNVLYHQDNINCKNILESTGGYKTLAPIIPELRSVSAGQNTELIPVSYKNSLSLIIRCWDTEIFIGTGTMAKEYPNATVYALKGQVNRRPPNAPLTAILEKPYRGKPLPEDCLYSFEKKLELKIDQDGVVKYLDP